MEDSALYSKINRLVKIIGMITVIITPLAVLVLWIYQDMYCFIYALPEHLAYESLDIKHFIPVMMYLFIGISIVYLRYKIIQADFSLRIMKKMKIYEGDGKRPFVLELMLFIVDAVEVYWICINFHENLTIGFKTDAFFYAAIYILVWSILPDPLLYRIIQRIKTALHKKADGKYKIKYTVMILCVFALCMFTNLFSHMSISNQLSYRVIKDVEVESDTLNTVLVIVFETSSSYIVEEATVDIQEPKGKKVLFINKGYHKYVEKKDREVQKMTFDFVIFSSM